VGEFGPYVFALVPILAVVTVSAIWLLRDTLRSRRETVDANIRAEELSDRLFAVSEQLERQRQLIEDQNDLVVRRDLSGRITMANAAFASAAGRPLEQLIGTTFKFLGPRDHEDHGGNTERFDQAVRIGREERWISWSIMAVTDRDGRIMERYAVGRDITERRRAEAANEAKSRFLATVSHEIRTPLNGVLGMADLLLDMRLPPEQGTYVHAIKTSGEALLSLIDEILDFSKIEAGKADLATDAFDLHNVAESVVELLAPRAQGKDLEIALSIDPLTPRTVIGDGARVRQVLLNLAGNAVKFTDQGGVGIDLRTDGSTLLIDVMDTGAGISADRLEAIFNEFEQADGTGSRSNEGTGLGLAISRKLIEHMGGNITVESTPGAGSRFMVSLPLRIATGGGPDAPSDLDLAGETFLVAAPGPFEGNHLMRRLTERGARVIRATDMQEALAALAENSISNALIDCSFGPEQTRDLGAAARRSGVGQSLVLLSPFERRSFGSPTEAGFDGYLVKPVRARSLYARLSQIPLDQSQLPAPALFNGTESSSSIRVLLAEDNDINALLATKLLERLGASVTWVKDGQSALDTALAAVDGTGPSFDLAMLDIRMPNLDGRTIAARIRMAESAKGAAPMRLAAVTANAFREDRAACLAAGFDEFLAKPLNRDALALIVNGARKHAADGVKAA
jgi:PAS domain S-box-containing protein